MNEERKQIKASILVPMTHAELWRCASDDTTRMTIMGIGCDLKENRVVATDGRQMVVAHCDVDGPEDLGAIPYPIVTVEAWKAAVKAAKGSRRDTIRLSFTLDATRVAYHWRVQIDDAGSNKEFDCIQGSFPNWKQIVRTGVESDLLGIPFAFNPEFLVKVRNAMFGKPSPSKGNPSLILKGFIHPAKGGGIQMPLVMFEHEGKPEIKKDKAIGIVMPARTASSAFTERQRLHSMAHELTAAGWSVKPPKEEETPSEKSSEAGKGITEGVAG